jgi:hypothetical protein
MMPTPGLSLIGFMEQQQAINYQRTMCVPADPSDAALLAEWNTARGNLGASITNAGQPDIQDIPPADQAYIQQLRQQQWVQQSLAPYPGADFKVVEIDPLLAFQFHILTDHSHNHCSGLGLGPGIADLLPIFLPQAPPQEALRVSGQGQSIIIAADTLNVRIMAQGMFQAENKVGIQFGIGLPFVHVARFNGRCYLMNGFHRALGARERGAGRVPCLFRDVAAHTEVGIRDDGSTFSVALLESANPPTLGHFTRKRAHDVAIRKVSRILQVNWSEHALPLE